MKKKKQKTFNDAPIKYTSAWQIKNYKIVVVYILCVCNNKTAAFLWSTYVILDTNQWTWRNEIRMATFWVNLEKCRMFLRKIWGKRGEILKIFLRNCRHFWKSFWKIFTKFCQSFVKNLGKFCQKIGQVLSKVWKNFVLSL